MSGELCLWWIKSSITLWQTWPTARPSLLRTLILSCCLSRCWTSHSSPNIPQQSLPLFINSFVPSSLIGDVKSPSFVSLALPPVPSSCAFYAWHAGWSYGRLSTRWWPLPSWKIAFTTKVQNTAVDLVAKWSNRNQDSALFTTWFMFSSERNRRHWELHTSSTVQELAPATQGPAPVPPFTNPSKILAGTVQWTSCPSLRASRWSKIHRGRSRIIY